MKTIKLISLDLDGTLFNNKSIITEKNKQAIKRATDAGISVGCVLYQCQSVVCYSDGEGELLAVFEALQLRRLEVTGGDCHAYLALEKHIDCF